ncbi:MAG TPA: UDP-glucose--hexose-1-phosphate uridylyltransferase [Clostridiales bacterium]|nr:UDP-glucose--hexose-1-phosphate uridylyltransferase [Clostridiales bacterium]
MSKETKLEINKHIANLIEYAVLEMDLDKYDAIFAHNTLLDLFKLDTPSTPSKKLPEFQTGIIDPIVDYAIKNNLCDENERIIFETKVMGIVTPPTSVVINNFDSIAATNGIQSATDYLLNISVKSNYIRTVDIDKNIKWEAKGKYGDLVVTINLSKPEKDNKQVALARSLPQTGYPKCVICLENLGFPGNLAKNARQTLRVIPLLLNDEEWFLQFSPYVYFDNHCLAISEKHTPMEINEKTFIRLCDFVEMFPHYFIGSNSDLPIVGGSILSHEHYQGGSKVLPMLNRPARKVFSSHRYENVKISVLDWYNSVIKLSSMNRTQLQNAANAILINWRNYTDKSVDIHAKTGDTPHNTITTIASWDDELGYELYLILRNNRTDEKHPYGIFHPTEDMHNIKKEGIGLIEAMGVFILPGRLDKEMKMIKDILTGKEKINFAAIAKDEHPLSKHLGMIAQLTNDYGTDLDEESAEKHIETYINTTCEKILNCTAVFKNDEKGQKAFAKFLATVGITE